MSNIAGEHEEKTKDVGIIKLPLTARLTIGDLSQSWKDRLHKHTKDALLSVSNSVWLRSKARETDAKPATWVAYYTNQSICIARGR
jgi:hypothetical protein